MSRTDRRDPRAPASASEGSHDEGGGPIRFGCGFVFGVASAVGSAWTWWDLGGLLGAAIVLGLLGGGLSYRYGDRFWHWLSDRGRWWWP